MTNGKIVLLVIPYLALALAVFALVACLRAWWSGSPVVAAKVACRWEETDAGRHWVLLQNSNGREMGGVKVWSNIDPGMFYPVDNGEVFRGYDNLQNAQADAVKRAGCEVK